MPESGKTAFVFGAGVDFSYQIPMICTLLRELAHFCRNEGKPVDAALRKKLPYLHFRFDKFAGEQSDAFLSDLFGAGTELNAALDSAVLKMKNDEVMQPVGLAIEQLCQMARLNYISGDSARRLSTLVGRSPETSSAELLLDPSKLSLSGTLSSAMRQSFERALLQSETFTKEEKEAFELFIVSTSNIEQLLSHYFSLFSLAKPADQRTYLYLSWMLWAFLQYKSGGKPTRPGSLYERLPVLGGDIITFNYTNFFDQQTAKKVYYFHGNLTAISDAMTVKRFILPR